MFGGVTLLNVGSRNVARSLSLEESPDREGDMSGGPGHARNNARGETIQIDELILEALTSPVASCSNSIYSGSKCSFLTQKKMS